MAYISWSPCDLWISHFILSHFWISSSLRFPFQDLVTKVQYVLYLTLLDFIGNVEDKNDLEGLIEQHFEALQKAFKIPHKASEAHLIVLKKLLTLFRAGKLGPFILDDVSNLLKLYYKANRCLHVLVSSCHTLNEKPTFQC